jgi:radical SAM superfamily enzyme YgiQ (UPF0313 family)
MKYEGDIIRPPSEAGSLLLQVTVGCSHNRCTFCPAYKKERFRIKSEEEIEEDLREASRYGTVERVFLCDGDALIIPQERLARILASIRQHVRGVRRIGTYANAKSILRKSVADLVRLRELGLGIVYLGVESGSDEVLKEIDKGVDSRRMVEAALRVKEAGIPLSCTVILGLGGREGSARHAAETAEILTEIDPEYASALTLMLVPGSPLYDKYRKGEFLLPDTLGLIRELGAIVSRSRFSNCFFTSNHASNYLPVRASMPRDRARVLELIADVLASGGGGRLRPEYLRGL